MVIIFYKVGKKTYKFNPKRNDRGFEEWTNSASTEKEAVERLKTLHDSGLIKNLRVVGKTCNTCQGRKTILKEPDMFHPPTAGTGKKVKIFGKLAEQGGRRIVTCSDCGGKGVY